MEACISQGATVLIGPSIRRMLKDAPLQTDNEVVDYISFLSKSELDGLSEGQRAALENLNMEHIYSLGATKDRSYLTIWNPGYLFRKSLKLPSYPFFPLFPLPLKPEHKTLPTLSNLKRPLDLNFFDCNMLDHLAFALLHAGDFDLTSQAATLLCDKSPLSEKGWLRLGDTAFKQGTYKRAMLAYGRMLHIPGVPHKLADYAVERITSCAEYTEWAQIFTEDEHEQLPPSLAHHLLEPWSPNVREVFFNIYSGAKSPTLQLDGDTKLDVRVTSTESKRLLRFFRWLVPFQVAVSSTPGSEEDISLLSSAHLGIKHVISLSKQPTIDETWFQGKSIKRTLIPIQDFHPPTIEQVECIMEIIMNPSNMPALIHCSAGIGRTGTIAACYLVAFGFNPPNLYLESPAMEATDAISTLCALRPGSVETAQQEALVAKWASVIWKRRSVLRPVVDEPPPCSLEAIGEIPSDADLLVLMGLQGMFIDSIQNVH